MSKRRSGGNSTRRDFVKGAGATALLLGTVPRRLLGAGRLSGASEERTLFFNFSHLNGLQTSHFLYLAGRKYRIRSVAENPSVLAFERRRNEFLSSVPDAHITHHVQGILVPLDMNTLAYTTNQENSATGTWAMTSMFFHIPQIAAAYAYAKAREVTPIGALPLSGKRAFYGLREAVTPQDIVEEWSLIDFQSHAEALVGVHPDILSLEPESGAHIHTNHIGPDPNVKFLAGELKSMGPAAPEGMGGMGGRPWATLQPIIDDRTGNPFKKSDGNLNQYHADWNPTVDQLAARGMGNVHLLVKQDVSLGSDITGYNLNDPTNPLPPEKMKGKLWARHDGIPTVDRSVTGSPGDPGPKVTFTYQNPEIGLRAWDPTHTTLPMPDGRVQVTLDNTSNWYLRWLGVWVQFFDAGDKVIPASALPPDTYKSEPGPYPRSGTDVSDAIFLGVVSNAFAVAGIPIYPGKFSPTVNIPNSAATMRVLYTGIGLNGYRPEDPQGIYGAGIGMTIVFNYTIVALFAAAGVSDLGSATKVAINLGAGGLAQEIQAITGTVINETDVLKFAEKFGLSFVKVLLQFAFTKGLVGQLVEFLAGKLVEAELIDAIPVAGQIARAIAAAVGVLQLAETYFEGVASPPAYVMDIVKTHDLSINILPDGKNTQFPEPPDGYTLYYKVSYIFEHGTAHTSGPVDVVDPTAIPIRITFFGILSGGQVNISIGFYMRQSRTAPGQNDWCAASGQTGLVDNTANRAPDLTIVQNPIPIQAATKYVHTRKTSLDGQGNHVWLATAAAPPYVPPPASQQPSLGDFRSITVRQGTSNPPRQGYLGYAWEALSTGVHGCGGAAPGQFDQMANVNTDAGNGGKNAQNGYANSANLCGFPGAATGVRLAYHLLTNDSANLYLDTTTGMLRPVDLNPPSFAGPESGLSFGQLNFDSTRCLLHPAGHVVSISQGDDRIEILKLPRVNGVIAAVPDKTAKSFFLARSLSATGKRPGLIMTPVAAAISPDGTILVLERDNNRIQAFDLAGNPVPHFKNQGTPYFLELDTTKGFTYLDMAVEFTGYLYVLSKDSSNNHRLDIYHPTQSGTQPISSTDGVTAAKLTVDFWRSVYTLNYEVLLLPGGGGIPGFTEPSVSQWLPTPPQVSLSPRVPRIHVPRR